MASFYSAPASPLLHMLLLLLGARAEPSDTTFGTDCLPIVRKNGGAEIRDLSDWFHEELPLDCTSDAAAASDFCWQVPLCSDACLPSSAVWVNLTAAYATRRKGVALCGTEKAEVDRSASCSSPDGNHYGDSTWRYLFNFGGISAVMSQDHYWVANKNSGGHNCVRGFDLSGAGDPAAGRWPQGDVVTLAHLVAPNGSITAVYVTAGGESRALASLPAVPLREGEEELCLPICLLAARDSLFLGSSGFPGMSDNMLATIYGLSISFEELNRARAWGGLADWRLLVGVAALLALVAMRLRGGDRGGGGLKRQRSLTSALKKEAQDSSGAAVSNAPSLTVIARRNSRKDTNQQPSSPMEEAVSPMLAALHAGGNAGPFSAAPDGQPKRS